MSKAEHPTCEYTEENRTWDNLVVPATVDREEMRRLAPVDMPAPLPPVMFSNQLTLKHLTLSPDMSQKTVAFAADVYFGRKCVGHASNSGTGSDTVIHPVARGSLDKAEAWAAVLPPMSSYQGVYELMLYCDPMFANSSAEEIRAAYRFHTSRVSLEHLVDAIVHRAEVRKQFKKMEQCAVLGLTKDAAPNLYPVVLYYCLVVRDEWLKSKRKTHSWAVRLRDFVDLPAHYYPSPHPFSGGSPAQKVFLRAGDKKNLGVVDYYGTTDHQVVVDLGNDEGGDPQKFTVLPAELQWPAKSTPIPGVRQKDRECPLSV